MDKAVVQRGDIITHRAAILDILDALEDDDGDGGAGARPMGQQVISHARVLFLRLTAPPVPVPLGSILRCIAIDCGR